MPPTRRVTHRPGERRALADRIQRQKVEAHPPSCYWEITDRCPVRCLHCWCPHKERSTPELTGNEALRLCDDLASLGTRSVFFTGGEPLMRPDWPTLARRLRAHGVAVHLRTSGIGLDGDALEAIVGAGIRSVTVSLDGPAEVHDAYRLPLLPGIRPFEAASGAISALGEAGIPLKVATQVNRRNLEHLSNLEAILVELGVTHWKLQLCRPDVATFGHGDLFLDPGDLPHLFRFLQGVKDRGRVTLLPAHTLGYFTEVEPLLRPRRRSRPPVWSGCEAGLRFFAVEADGGVKGCVSLGSEFVTASVLERSIADIWRDDDCFPYTRAWKDAWFAGECRECTFRDLCRAGCTAVAYGATGSVGYDPYCLHRVRGMAADQGRR